MLDLIASEAGQLDAATATLHGEVGASELSTKVDSHSLALLCHQTSHGIAVSGVAALAMKPNLPFVHPSSLTARWSRMLTEAGDVDPLGDT